jgi:drug/metabolite transporter (DMT)-like permease
MDLSIIGQIAAILTSVFWTLNSLLFTTAGKKIGSISVNSYRIIAAVIFLSLTHIIIFGQILPYATSDQWFWIGLSGIIGLGIGDFGLFASFVIIGPRRSLLIMSLSPLFAAVLAFLILNETLTELAILGMIITIVGIIIVIIEKEEKSYEEIISKKQKIWGVFLAFIGAIGQGTGAVLAKKGIYFDINNIVNPLSATLIRMIIAAIFIWICVIIAGKIPELKKAIKDKKGIKLTIAGAFLGPFIGVTFSMIAVTFTEVGVAQTLMSLMPVMIIPIIYVLYKQKTNIRGIIGSFISILGVAILFLI